MNIIHDSEKFITRKPKVVIFRAPVDLFPANNHHVLVHKMDKFYSYYFNCTIIDYLCDYNEIVDKYEPDFVIFHLVNIEFIVKNIRNIQNIRSLPQVIVGILDTSDFERFFFGSFLEKYDIDSFFHTGCDLSGTYPEFKKYLFNFPHFIDSDINYDYRIEKNIPVLLTGNIGGNFYVWREEIRQPIIDNFPTLYFRHPGYYLESKVPDMLRVHGEKYFKTLSSSWIAPTCGSMKNIVIMKHLEIPGAGCCLICEETDTVKAHGFRDMENCVFAKPENIVDKIQYLFENPDLLDQITKSGYEFVHSHHTYKQRAQILQWYQLNNIKMPGQKIVQPYILGDLELVDEKSEKETIYFKDADDIIMVTDIDDSIHEGKYFKAGVDCKKVISIAEYIHDAKLRLYIIHMLNGRKEYGFKILKSLFGNRMGLDFLPDPVNLSFLILHLLSTKKIEKAVYYSCIGLTKRRKELDYIRLLTFRLSDEKVLFNSLLNEISNSHNDKEYKTFYYFYSKQFNLFNTIKNIAYRNLKGINSILLKNIKAFPDLEPISLAILEKPFNKSILAEDLIEMDLKIKTMHKIKKHMQEFIHSIKERVLRF